MHKFIVHLNARKVKMVMISPTMERILPAREKALRALSSFGGDVRAFTSYKEIIEYVYTRYLSMYTLGICI